jgi:ABC-2 type transport system ATP-binding protein
MENSMPILSIRNVVKEYSAHTALAGVSMDIPRGSVFGLLGPNGAGKTSLIRIITGITRPDSGELIFKGRTMTTDDYLKIGYLPEERGLYKKMKVGEQLLYLAQLRGLSEKEARLRIRKWSQRMDLDKWLEKEVSDLSKGMQQKVQFIATVIHEPELVILDEPFSGFDPLNANILTEEILDLKAKGATIIFSTHRMETVEELCDHVALINKSKVVLLGRTDEIRAQASLGDFLLQATGTLPDLNMMPGVEAIGVLGKQDTYQVHLPEGITANMLLGAIMSQMQLISFTERIPTMRDIFISTVLASGEIVHEVEHVA